MIKSAKKWFTNLLSLILVVSIIISAFIPVLATQVQGITSGSTYMLKNKGSNKYLTIPRYTDTEKNVYQDTSKINDEYYRAVTVTYLSDGYSLSPLIYNTIGQGYIVSDSGNNVYCSSVNTNNIWNIEYVVGKGGYKISNQFGNAITAVGLSSGNVSDNSVSANGNIIVSAYNGSDNQIWYFESVTVNPHMAKNELVTKKNLGTGAEWLIRLSDSEMNSPNVSIVDVSVSRENLVTVEQYGKWLLVRMNTDNETPYDTFDDYAIIKITLSYGIERLVIVQDAGTGSNDSCRTIPFNSDIQLYTITLDSGEPQRCILTFKSTLGAVSVYKWEIENQTSAIEFAEYSGKTLSGTNFAVVDILDIGFAVITATNSRGDTYTMVIEVKSRETDGTYRNSSDIKRVTSSQKDFELKLFRSYLFYLDDSVTIYSDWTLYNQLDDPTKLTGNDKFVVFNYITPGPATLNAAGCNISITQAKGAIIILPGMMGSQIYSDELIHGIDIGATSPEIYYSPGTRLWDPDANLSAPWKVNAIAMDSSGLPKYATYVNAPLVNDANNPNYRYGAMDIYRNIYSQLYNDYYFDFGYDIILYEYDWRYDPYEVSLQLDTYISANDYKDVILVSHSWGGNVASYYISLGEIQRNKINKNISIATPYLGSVQLLYAYTTGMVLEFNSVLDDFIDIIGFNDAVKDVITNIPCSYAALPIENGFVPYIKYAGYNSDTPIIVTDYVDTMVLLNAYMPNWNSSLADKVIANQYRLFTFGGKHITTLVDSYYIVGNGVSTKNMLNFSITDEGLLLNDIVNNSSGDNTVTVQSATVNGTLLYNRVYYKYDTDEFFASHISIIEGKKDNKTDYSTIEFVSALINKKNMGLLDSYGMVRNN